MGFHIPDSPRRNCANASSQTTTTTTAVAANPNDNSGPQFSERFSSRTMRRRNAITPTLFIDVVGSPRSPHICLSRDNRFALSQQQQQQVQETVVMSSNDHPAASANDPSRVKRAPGVRRRSEQRDAASEMFSSRAALNVYETP